MDGAPPPCKLKRTTLSRPSKKLKRGENLQIFVMAEIGIDEDLDFLFGNCSKTISILVQIKAQRVVFGSVGKICPNKIPCFFFITTQKSVLIINKIRPQTARMFRNNVK